MLVILGFTSRGWVYGIAGAALFYGAIQYNRHITEDGAVNLFAIHTVVERALSD